MSGRVPRLGGKLQVDTAGEGGFFGVLVFDGASISSAVLGAANRVKVHLVVVSRDEWDVGFRPADQSTAGQQNRKQQERRC